MATFETPGTASRRGRLQHLRRLRDVGQPGRLRDPLLHHLAGPVEVGPGLEDHVDGGRTWHRLRPNLVEPGHAIEQVLLQGHRDQLLDFLGGKPERLGLDLYRYRLELREHISLGVTKLPDANRHDHDGGSDNGTTSSQTRPDQPTHHGWRPPCAYSMVCEELFAVIRIHPAEDISSRTASCWDSDRLASSLLSVRSAVGAYVVDRMVEQARSGTPVSGANATGVDLPSVHVARARIIQPMSTTDSSPN
jgi:hypothetical protein